MISSLLSPILWEDLTEQVTQLADLLSNHPHYPTHTVEIVGKQQAEVYRLPANDIVLLENNTLAIRRPGAVKFHVLTNDQLSVELHERIICTLDQCNQSALQPVQQQHF